MTELTSEMRAAFLNLGVSPGSCPSTIRAAWRAMVRRYHPDQTTGDRARANAQLAELNAAYDLISAWTPDDAKAFARSAQQKSQKHKRTAARKAHSKPFHAQERVDEHAHVKTKADETVARAKKPKPEAKETMARPARSQKTAVSDPRTVRAQKTFLDALCAFAPATSACYSVTL